MSPGCARRFTIVTLTRKLWPTGCATTAKPRIVGSHRVEPQRPVLMIDDQQLALGPLPPEREEVDAVLRRELDRRHHTPADQEPRGSPPGILVPHLHELVHGPEQPPRVEPEPELPLPPRRHE